ncbi:MAG: NUDIX hydrolase [Clostridia bacterium]|nr:NUDIX hydrolase [Clostridia bacterium]
MNLEEKQLKKEYMYKGKIINLRRDEALLPNGKTAIREIVEHNGGVCVVPLDDDGNVYMVQQFRYPYFKVVTEIPAGKLEKGEDPLEAGKRELKEEVGAIAQNYVFLGELYPSPGYCGEIIHMYLATGLSFCDTDPDEDEFLEPVKIPLKTAVDMVLKNELADSKTQAAILKAYLLMEKGE